MIRLSQSEREDLEALAAADGQKVADWIRCMIRDEKRRRGRPR